MADHRNGGGTNSRPLNDTIAESGPGIPDDPLGPGETLPDPVDEATVQQVAEQLNKLGRSEGP
jgi:hypothetical protein